MGIGTATPTAKLHVRGEGKFTQSVQVGSGESNRCTTIADAGKIVIYTYCSATDIMTTQFL